MSNDIEKLRELKKDFIARAISCGIQYVACGQISHALNKAIESLAAPASGAALSVIHDHKFVKALGEYAGTVDLGSAIIDLEIPEHATLVKIIDAAIAHQPPKEALTDRKILDMANSIGNGGFYQDARDDNLIDFARAIEAATGPNKALMEALRAILADCDPNSRNGVRAADALSAAGATLKGE